MTLAIAGLVSGVAIIGIYETTLPTITANKARELREAVFKVLPGVTRMQALVYRDGRIMVVPEPQKDEPVVYGGYDEQGEFVGYAMPGAGPETPGLGDKIYKDADFVAEFSALSVEPEIVAVKKGTATLDNHVDAITGATISAKAVVRIINETHVAWAEQLPAPGTEPPLAGDAADSETGQ